MRILNVAAAQMGPIQKAESREAVVKRMVALLNEEQGRRPDRLSGVGADHLLPALLHA
jgi:hypothetical protein